MTGYLDFYGLKKAPFEVRFGRGLVLATAPLRKVLERLEAELQTVTQVVAVTGPSGIGRSSLARALPKSFRDWARVARIADPTLPWSELRGRIAVQLGLEDGRLSCSGLKAARAASGRLVLAVDGAEELAPETLDHLGVLLDHRAESGDPVLQCVMLVRSDVDEPETAPVLGWLDSRSAPRVEFASLTPGLTRSYIEKRLRHAGRESRELFSRAAAAVVHRLSGGIPCAVNQVCDAALAEALRRAVEQVDADLVCEAWGEPQEAGAPVPPTGVVDDPHDEASWLGAPDQATALADAGLASARRSRRRG
jgi:type II secretory pathway predicted ATPase ExeA